MRTTYPSLIALLYYTVASHEAISSLVTTVDSGYTGTAITDIVAAQLVLSDQISHDEAFSCLHVRYWIEPAVYCE